MNLRKHPTITKSLLACALLILASSISAKVTLEKEVKITDEGLHFNGRKLTHQTIKTASTKSETYDFSLGQIYQRMATQ